jgi:hypothetical protein
MCVHDAKGKLTGVSGTKIRVDVLVCMCVCVCFCLSMYICEYVCTRCEGEAHGSFRH